MSHSNRTPKSLWEKMADKLREWAQTLDDALSPPPELVPVPVKNRRNQ